MGVDRITQLRISGLRTIADLTLDLHELTVLVGDNGVGKSSIVEALELVHMAGKSLHYAVDVIDGAHGGLRSLLRRGAPKLELGVSIEGGGPKIEYEFHLGLVGRETAVIGEFLRIHEDPTAPEPFYIIVRHGPHASVFDQRRGVPMKDRTPAVIGASLLGLPSAISIAPEIVGRTLAALEGIQVHVPFETRPVWQAKELDIRRGPRWPVELEQTKRLSRFGLNLPNVFLLLRNQGNGVWQRVIERARLGLGDDLRDFRVDPVGRGSVELQLLYGRVPEGPLPAEYLSEGELSFLCFVALCELHTGSSLLAMDEPELHLHPALLARVVWMLEDAAKASPIVLATHSDRLLDALAQPASSVVLCELDQDRQLQLRRPDAVRLAEWLKDYRGIGSLRAEGYEAHIFGEQKL